MTLTGLLSELVTIEERHRVGLVQYQRLVSAHQYVGLLDLATRHIPAGGRVLDWGSGNGHASYLLARMGYAVTAFSLEFMPPFAPHAPDVRWVMEGEPDRLPFDDASFDAVMSVGVLEHVRETGGEELASLREIRRVLRPSGVFLCYHFPNRHSYIDLAATLVPGAHRHTYRYTRRDIDALVSAAGLSTVAVKRYGALPRNPWQALPRWLADSRVAARVWDLLDDLLAWPLAPVVQNFAFVARA